MDLVPLNRETWIICGGRDFSDRAMFDDAMSEVIRIRGCPTRIVQGGASGADRLAFEWATRMAIPCIEVYADWDAHGKSAGPIRNQKMLDYNPSVLVAFPGGRGTADMVERSRKTGLDVIEVKPKGLAPETAPVSSPHTPVEANKEGEPK